MSFYERCHWGLQYMAFCIPKDVFLRCVFAVFCKAFRKLLIVRLLRTSALFTLSKPSCSPCNASKSQSNKALSHRMSA